MTGLYSLLVFSYLIILCSGLQSISDRNKRHVALTNPAKNCITSQSHNFDARRRGLISLVGSSIASMSTLPERSEAKSYSSNARNLERMNTGDMSGGSLYDNNPTTAAGRRRRAMTGCKSSIAREEASSKSILNLVNILSEKDCNQMVLEGNPEFMLQSLRNLDCPSCPYGIATSRKSL